MTSMTPPVAREYPAFPSKKRERSLSCSADPAPKKARTGAVKAAVLADPVAAVRKSSLPSRKRERSLSSSPTTDIALHTPDPAAKKARTSATATDLTNPVINIPPEDTTETGFRIGPARNDPRHPADNKLHMDPADVRKHFDRIGHFRILVIGRANAGKTTLLQRLSNSIELPEIFNSKGERINPTTVQGSLERGYHNIDDELIFRSNPGFIFHDSRGFETGSEDELKMMKDFLTDRAATMKLDKRIHAVWYGQTINSGIINLD
ncbi:hypothetical protein V8B97DRAFT_1288768 [Scleroderma yunnanense]